MSELEYWTKRLHTNPFLQMRVACGPIYDDESDSTLSERSSRSSQGVEGDDEMSAYSELDDSIPQQVELKRTIDPYLGLFRPGEDGRYNNHIKTIEAIFRPLKSIGRMHLVIIQNWLRLEIPSLITYRISSGMGPRDVDDEPATVYKGKPIPRNSTFASLTEVQKMGWLTVVDQYQTDRCIICGRCFNNMYALMLHYHLSYPRLTFQLNFRIDPQMDENWHRLHIDVFLNPDFDDVNEVITDSGSRWVNVKDPLYIWTRASKITAFSSDQAKELKSKLRMDLTIFCDSLRSAGQTWDDPVEEHRFIHPESGRFLYRGERLPRYARHLPAPGHEVLIHNTTRVRVYEYKRLFLELHIDTMVRYRQRSHFIYQLNTQTQRGRPVTDLEDLVLRLYNARRDYDPLLDELHPIRDWIYADLKRGYDRYRSDREKPHKDSSGMRRSFPKMYRTDPSTLSVEQLHKLFLEILEAGVVVPFNHPFRKYLHNVVDVLFEGEMPVSIASLRDQDDFLSDLIRSRELS
ncbi:hypothetical protein DICVIV_06779 [Dictyocaulus viviparus]|uniref:Uncharacterized protein n=1 Tax=Dictyocaulus viviparus TaxID=29172 RepID=A0A0D8XR17_DICVI|nr:hypothetical protein DICVIV_06779 [Dictyocaulus viviparus]